MLKYNPITDTDSYKFSHFLQYPPGTEFINSYIESRGGAYNDVVFFGLQAFLKAYLSVPFTLADIDEAEAAVTAHGLTFNRAGFEYILNKHGGHWPVKISALKEGTVLRPHNCLVQVINTDPMVPWVTSFLETALLRAVWYPTTVASRSRKIKTIIKKYLEDTADDLSGLLFKLHDFGARGVSSRESSAIGGAAHLVNFAGTDTFEALRFLKAYYDEPMAGFSIPAAEHSTITSWSRTKEGEAYKNMVDKFGGQGKLVAVVSDSYDIFHAVNHIWPSLKAHIEQVGGTVVVRPDSGDPTDVVLKVVDGLAHGAGFSYNSKGYRLLHPSFRVIQGDGINEDSVKSILDNLKAHGYSADNVAFGMGGEMLQTPNRDTNKFAMKASAAIVNGTMRNVSKEPVGDKSKKSKEGILKVVDTGTGLSTVDHKFGGWDRLEPVYLNGQVLRDQKFAEIRKLAEV
jgi:nicotinamide phosphoribosyltransferase